MSGPIRYALAEWRRTGQARSTQNAEARAFEKEVCARQPGFREAVRADTRITSAHRGRRIESDSRALVAIETLRLLWTAMGSPDR